MSTSKWTQITKSKIADLKLGGAEVSTEWNDASLNTVTVRIGGEAIKIQLCSYGTMGIYMPAPPELVQRWHITGKCVGFAVDELYSKKWGADQRMSKLGSYDDTEVSCAEVKVDASLRTVDET